MTENITTGLIKTYWDEEKTKLSKEYFICDGKKEGIYKTYWNNGQLKEEGIYKQYWDNGRLCLKITYIDGKENGIYES